MYRNQVPAGFRERNGAWVRIRSGDFSGLALWDDTSQVALRVFARKGPVDARWVEARVREAWALRRSLAGSEASAFRLLYGEGDGLPGVVVDYYAGFCVLVTYSSSLRQVASWVTEALTRLPSVRGVISKHLEGKELDVLAGDPPPERLVVEEERWKLSVDLASGQKTGLFLDHRDNRRFISEHTDGARMLNLFSYTGAFSLAALAGGARHVTSVDSAAPALEAARHNFRLNGYDPEEHSFEVSDVLSYLEAARQRQQCFDVVVCDPPSFAKRREQLRLALKTYRKLSVLGLRVTLPGGLYAAASCTSQVGPEQFRQVLAEAGQRANRRLQIVHEAYHAIDHPTFIGHPEGRYLKFIVLRVLEPC